MVAENCLGFYAIQTGDGVVMVAGEVDVATAPFLELALREAATSSSGDLVVDLAGVPFLDSAGMNVFVRMYKTLHSESRGLTLANPCRSVRRALEIGGAGSFANLR